MSAAPAAAASDAEAPKKGKKKLIIIAAVVAVLLLGGGGAGVFLMKKKAHDAEVAAQEEGEGEDGEEEEEVHKPAKKIEKPKKDEHAIVPTFVPLDPFVVNLSDKDAERYAQVGIQLQMEDAAAAEEIKAYVPAVRNAVLMILSHKSSEELLSTEGKAKLAAEIRRETARAMGYKAPPPDDDEAAEHDDDEAASAVKKKKKKKKKKKELYNPVVQVHYSNFIIQ